MRKFLTIIVYSLIMLLIGRNLTILPQFSLFSNPKTLHLERAQRLKEQVQQQISKSEGTYSVYFFDLKNQSSFGINEKQTHTGASVNKVPIAATLYYLNKAGKIDLDEQITLQKDDIQDYGTGTLRYQKPGGVYSLRTLARLALQQSDNTAAHVLSNKLETKVIQRTMESFGLSQTNMEENKISVYDLFLLFQKIYSGQVTDTAKTKELFNFMRDTDIEDRLPLHLPLDSTIYHKTGDSTGSMHDVGIIEKEGIAFFLGVMTSDIGNHEKETAETIAQIAKIVLESYSN